MFFGDRLTAGFRTLNPAMQVQILLPEPAMRDASPKNKIAPGQLLLVVTPGSEPGGRWFDSNPRNLGVEPRMTLMDADRKRQLIIRAFREIRGSDSRRSYGSHPAG